MTSKRTKLLGCAVGLALMVPTVSSAATKRNSRSCYRLQVSAPNAKKRSQRAFSASQVIDVNFKVMARRLDGQHEMKLKVYTPAGHLYQTIAVPFSSSSSDDELTRRRRRRRRNFQAVTASLPVAGTSITANSLYGKWKVEAYLDSEPVRCTRPRRFVIKP